MLHPEYVFYYFRTPSFNTTYGLSMGVRLTLNFDLRTFWNHLDPCEE